MYDLSNEYKKFKYLWTLQNNKIKYFSNFFCNYFKKYFVFFFSLKDSSDYS